MTVGILGMAFKGESRRHPLEPELQAQADPASSRPSEVLCTDPYVTVDPDLVPLDEVLAESDLLVIGAPHRAYARPRRPTCRSSTCGTCCGDGVRV